MIEFGAWSTALATLAGEMALLAGALLLGANNKLANRLLAALLLVLCGMMLPFILGYAGFYDAHPWLTAAPFAIPLAAGPLFYGYVRALTEQRGPGWRHFAAPAIQFAYQTVLFCLPLETRWWWDDHVSRPLLGPLISAAVFVSMAIYTWATWKASRRYEAWLAERRRATRPAKRVRVAAALLGILLSARAGYEIFEAVVRPVGYSDLFGFNLLLGIIGLAIGLDGWRHAGSPSPAMTVDPERDWETIGRAWIEELRANEWWRDPELDLPTLARRLGTNTNHLSRALNDHAGGFATTLSRIRSEAVAKAIDDGSNDDLLVLGLDAGFGSKASFNRSFRTRFGMSPSEYRRARGRLIS